jgi:hypothetical protein
MSLLMRGKGSGGNREVPPIAIRAGGAAKLQGEGGSWGKQGFPHATEPKAEEA